MPTYDYKCENCDHMFEYFQAMSDLLLKKCPECSGKIRVGFISPIMLKRIQMTKKQKSQQKQKKRRP